MKKELVNEVVNCLPQERTIFRYFKGRYAFMLLNNVIGSGVSVSQLKKSSFSGLLEKPEIKEALAIASDGRVTPRLLESVWPGETLNFILTVGTWGSNCHRWDQTSRRGYNLVLQMNFSNHHDCRYKAMVKPKIDQFLNYFAHPVLWPDERDYFRETLSWARIDLDFESDTALIEEIQSDWIRRAKRLSKLARNRKKYNREHIAFTNANGKMDDIIHYCENVLDPYYKIWDEAMLAATIEFIRIELGISNIYYHSVKTGPKVKSIKYTKPPVSIYSKLPRRFCFNKTDSAPEFLYSDRYFRKIYNKVQDPEWYHMKI